LRKRIHTGQEKVEVTKKKEKIAQEEKIGSGILSGDQRQSCDGDWKSGIPKIIETWHGRPSKSSTTRTLTAEHQRMGRAWELK
jgi:hypothetical protein